MKIVLGAYTIDKDSQRHQIPLILNPDKAAVDEILLALKDAKGVIGVRPQPALANGPYELMLYVDDGNFLLMLNEYDEDGDTNVRTISKVDAKNDLMPIPGECYPSQVVTPDIDLVSSIFKTFISTGNVPDELMS